MLNKKLISMPSAPIYEVSIHCRHNVRTKDGGEVADYENDTFFSRTPFSYGDVMAFIAKKYGPRAVLNFWQVDMKSLYSTAPFEL